MLPVMGLRLSDMSDTVRKETIRISIATSSGGGRFRERLAILVQKTGSQSALSKLSGVAQPQISRFLQGDGEPVLSTLISLARAGKVTVAWLIGESD